MATTSISGLTAALEKSGATSKALANPAPVSKQAETSQKQTTSKPATATNSSPPSSTVVSISAAAKAALAEATETAAQTAKESRSGDRQAQHLLAKQAAAQKVG